MLECYLRWIVEVDLWGWFWNAILGWILECYVRLILEVDFRLIFEVWDFQGAAPIYPSLHFDTLFWTIYDNIQSMYRNRDSTCVYEKTFKSNLCSQFRAPAFSRMQCLFWCVLLEKRYDTSNNFYTFLFNTRTSFQSVKCTGELSGSYVIVHWFACLVLPGIPGIPPYVGSLVPPRAPRDLLRVDLGQCGISAMPFSHQVHGQIGFWPKRRPLGRT